MIRIGALLHDVGLLGVPARIMTKPDILSVTEMQLMRQHPANSEMILQELPGFEEVAVWIARHHERPDGKGYPEMLVGDDIPMESRILAIADVYAALMSDRPHRGALSPKRREAGAARRRRHAARPGAGPHVLRAHLERVSASACQRRSACRRFTSLG